MFLNDRLRKLNAKKNEFERKITAAVTESAKLSEHKMNLCGQLTKVTEKSYTIETGERVRLFSAVSDTDLTVEPWEIAPSTIETGESVRLFSAVSDTDLTVEPWEIAPSTIETGESVRLFSAVSDTELTVEWHWLNSRTLRDCSKYYWDRWECSTVLSGEWHWVNSRTLRDMFWMSQWGCWVQYGFRYQSTCKKKKSFIILHYSCAYDLVANNPSISFS